MEPIVRDVTSLDEFHRRALEERAPQSLEAWSHVYDELSAEEIAQVDEVAKSRAKLTRNA